MGNLCTIALVALALVQGDVRPYVGTWVADINSVTFVRLELNVSDGRLIGRLGIGNFQVDTDGEVTSAIEAQQPLPMVDVALRDSMLAFSRKNGDSTERFELRPAGEGGALLTIVLSADDLEDLAASGIAVLKPIRLKRVIR
jgi:hypothetical protein